MTPQPVSLFVWGRVAEPTLPFPRREVVVVLGGGGGGDKGMFMTENQSSNDRVFFVCVTFSQSGQLFHQCTQLITKV